MLKLSCAMAIAIAGGHAMPAAAAIVSATPATLATVFAAVKAGDTIKLTGTFGGFGFNNRIFSSAVTIDATTASFTDTVTISNVSKLTFIGGTYGSATTAMRAGRAVGIYGSNNVQFSKSFFVGNAAGMGLTMAGSSNISVSAGNFKNFKTGLGVTSSKDVRIGSSRFIGMTSDGVNIADSHRVTATSNRCTDAAPFAGAHPDCIQLWSILGNNPQSDIVLTKTFVSGATQGLTSFNPESGGGLRISMTDNTISTSYPQGIACYGCVDSIFTGNMLTTLPGAQWRTSMNIVGGSNNIIANNSIAAKPAAMAVAEDELGDTAAAYDPSTYYNESLPDFVREDLAILAASGWTNSAANADTGSSLESGPDAGMAFGDLDVGVGRFSASGVARFSASGAGAVPEPAIWAQLIFGFGLVGFTARRRAVGRSYSA